MSGRAAKSGVILNEADAAVVKAMLARGDRQHDIASWFGVNGGRIAEIATSRTFEWVEPAEGKLPPSGPYPRGKDAIAALEALAMAKLALDAAREAVLHHC